MAKKLLPILITTTLLTPLATLAQTDTPNDSKEALAKVQTQIQHVADSIPQQIQASQATTNAALAKQQQAIQEQLAHLQSEIEQLQKQNQTSTTGLQKEIQALQNKG
ncbi:MAG TPA: hypothetical protein DCL40_02605 [Coxiellaceae bacterium]|nr:hypothetical protein [Coxiellaceae bacterium]